MPGTPNPLKIQFPTNPSLNDIYYGYICTEVTTDIAKWERIEFIDRLDSVSTTQGLTANQGRVLEDKKQNTSEKNQPNGYAGLDANSRIASAQLPTGMISLDKVWDVTNNIPNLTGTPVPAVGTAYMVIGSSLTRNLNGITTWKEGDIAIVAGDSRNKQWTRLVSREAVTSVASKTGAVVLAKGDVGLGKVDNTSDADKPVSTATANALKAKLDKSGGTMTGALTTTRTTFSNTELVTKTEVGKQITAAAYTHPTVTAGDVNASTGLKVISRVRWNSLGHILSVTSRSLDLAAYAIKTTVNNALSALQTRATNLETKTTKILGTGTGFSGVFNSKYPTLANHIANKNYVDRTINDRGSRVLYKKIDYDYRPGGAQHDPARPQDRHYGGLTFWKYPNGVVEVHIQMLVMLLDSDFYMGPIPKAFWPCHNLNFVGNDFRGGPPSHVQTTAFSSGTLQFRISTPFPSMVEANRTWVSVDQNITYMALLPAFTDISVDGPFSYPQPGYRDRKDFLDLAPYIPPPQ